MSSKYEACALTEHLTPFCHLKVMKQKRNEVTVEIRKNKREETLQKRRNVPVTEDTTGKKNFQMKLIFLLNFFVKSYVVEL